MFVASLAVVTLMAPFASFGQAQFWLKIYGEEGWFASRWLPSSLKLISICSLFVLATLIIFAVFTTKNSVDKKISLILSLYIFGQLGVELLSSKLQLEESYSELSLWQFTPQLLRLLFLILLVLFLPLELVIVSLGYAVISIFVFVIALYKLNGVRAKNFDLKGHTRIPENIETESKPGLYELILKSWPFGLAGFLFLIYFQSDLILVKYLVGPEAAGMYGVAFTVMSALYILPGVIFQKFLLPKIHRWSYKNRYMFRKVFEQGNIIMFAFGVIGTMSVWTLSSWGIPFLFGEGYDDSIILLNFLSLTAPVMFLIYSVGTTLTTKEHMKTKVYCMAVIAVLNIILNLVFIPFYGAMGAVIATLISNILLLLLYYLVAHRIVFKND